MTACDAPIIAAVVMAWAVEDVEGIHINTIFDSRRGAIVNYLITRFNMVVFNQMSDYMIEDMWQERRGTYLAAAIRVSITKATAA